MNLLLLPLLNNKYNNLKLNIKRLCNAMLLSDAFVLLKLSLISD